MKDGNPIEVYVWKPSGAARAVVLQCHGLGEHAERYHHVADFFTGHGIAFVAYDHRGHGRSGGKRGHIASYGQLLEEVDAVKAEAVKRFGEVPQVIYGHSWGGGIALNYLLRREHGFAAAIVTGPWLELPPEQAPSPFLAFLAKTMNAVYPAFQNDNQIDIAALSTDLSVGEAYAKDPLVHGKISAGNFIKSNDAGGFALAQAAKIDVPLLLMHGAEDQITSPEGSRKFSATAGPKVHLKLWEGMRHEIHNEVEKEKVLGEMLDFVEKHLPAAGGHAL